ncbi:MAG: helix-turn-helix domain-containing protein [Caulobacteraceae bacterium]|nr:helix-turn-helix domain-containing protein [Caulobacteraceae bacterium]
MSWSSAQDAGVRAPTLGDGPNTGAALRAIREFYGLDLEALTQTTRVRRAYLQAIEDMRLDHLPSRPFTLGYVRAYAAALGLDADQAVARFRYDAPADDQTLRAPVGVAKERDPRLALIAVCGAVVGGGILLWNIAQHAVKMNAPPPAIVAESSVAQARPAAPPQGPVTLGAPLPAPPESTTPKPYVTPGLESAMSNANAVAASAAGDIGDDEATAAGLEQAAPLGSPFTPKGTVFGVTPAQAVVILQARKAASLTIHGADGSVYFARLLSAGQAYRAPMVKGLMIEVSEPDAFDVFVANQLRGSLPTTQVPITRLTQ